jgi:hypothetical protein
MSAPTPDALRELRRDVVSIPPDSLDRLLLMQQRKMLIDALWCWESTLEKPMTLDEKAEAVASTPAPELAKIIARGVFAAAFPLVLFAPLIGFAAGLAVGVFKFTLSLF